jgi:hypothetical protein
MVTRKNTIKTPTSMVMRSIKPDLINSPIFFIGILFYKVSASRFKQKKRKTD